jgi:hypothetical protein
MAGQRNMQRKWVKLPTQMEALNGLYWYNYKVQKERNAQTAVSENNLKLKDQMQSLTTIYHIEQCIWRNVVCNGNKA